MNEFEFLLNDRITKIKALDEKYDLKNNAYISFSGGKDSTVLHHLIDLALPDNHIPRIYINTGIEYKAMIKFVERERERQSYYYKTAKSKYKNDVIYLWLPIQK